jgi:signal transduction histidine kinase
VNTLLDFSRIEAGRIKALYRPVELCGRTAELGSVFRSAMERAGLKYKIDCKPLPEPVYIDLDMWEKIVLNLLSNAFKFTLEGSVEMTLRAVDGYAELAVRDTGIGIPEAGLPRIFERFHRIEGAVGGRTREPVSGWRWSMNWYGYTAERWGRRVCLARARPLRRGFRSGRPICR